jgi:hypothetical protein
VGVTLVTAPMAVGCKRGWLAEVLEEVGLTRSPSAQDETGRALPILGTDCPDGLARCYEGTVEVSRLARLGPGCEDSKGGCNCPWDVVGTCGGQGCVAEGVTLALPASLARSQLCSQGGAQGMPPILPMPSPGPGPGEPDVEISACEDLEFVCRKGVVLACGAGEGSTERRPRILSRCALGCSEEGGSLLEPMKDEQALAILCLRGPQGQGRGPL